MKTGRYNKEHMRTRKLYSIISLGNYWRGRRLKITDIRVINNRKPITLPEAWRPAWNMPDVTPIKTASFSYIEVETDEEIKGIAPGYLSPDHLNRLKRTLVGSDPFFVEKLGALYLGGRSDFPPSYKYLDIAFWDIIGKAANQPIYKLLGAYTDKLPVYIATCQLHSPDEHVREALEYRDRGIRAIKLRLHRQNHNDDLEVVKAVRNAVGDDMIIMVDANQNNVAPTYNYWSRRTAKWMATQLDKLDVYFLEDPLPLSDLEGIQNLSNSVDMSISGGEHGRDIYHFRDLLFSRAFDIIQPDIMMGTPGVGITGIKKIAQIADSLGRAIIPHVVTGSLSGLDLAATIQVMATVKNCPFVEYPLEPPALTIDVLHGLLQNPLLIDDTGHVQVPKLPGIGIEINEEFVKQYV